MLKESRHFYATAAEKNKLSIDLVKSIGDHVFQNLSDLTKNCPNLIITIQGLGRRFVRKRKTEELLSNLLYARKILTGEITGKTNPRSLESIDADIVIIRGYLEQYDFYLSEKQRVKNLRHEFTQARKSTIPPPEVL